MEKQAVIALIVMIVSFLVVYFAFSKRSGAATGATTFALLGASIFAALASGFGFPIRHLVEGEFGYFDIVLVILTGLIFLRTLEANGSIEVITKYMVKHFMDYPVIFLVLTMIFLYLPGMVTGLGAPAVVTVGALVVPIFRKIGLSKKETATLISVAACMGSVTGPVNIPAMIVANSINMPYEGFGWILPLITVPVGIFTMMFIAFKPTIHADLKAVKAEFGPSQKDLAFWRGILPIGVVVVLMVLVRAVPFVIPDMHTPLIFAIGTIVALLSGKPIPVVKVMTNAVDSPILEIASLLISVGVLVQISSLTGVTGLLVVNCLGLPSYLIYIGMGLVVPLLGGAVSMLGTAAILGLPIVTTLVTQNTIVVTAAFSVLCALAQLVPPSAIVSLLAAKVVDTDEYNDIFKASIIPGVATVVVCLVILAFANKLAFLV